MKNNLSTIVQAWVEKAEDDLSFAKDARESVSAAEKIVEAIKEKLFE